jgi:hypothetical protein
LQPLLFDEGLPGGNKVSVALVALGWTAATVGDPGAPPSGSGDEINCQWCKSNNAVLVTHDRGKGNREILQALDQLQVGAILILRDLRKLPPRRLALALLRAEEQLDTIATSSHRLRHQLRKTGRLVKP